MRARGDVEREMELKLILGSNFDGWNLSENFIAEKNLADESLGVRLRLGGQPTSRPSGQVAQLHFLPGKVSGRP